MSDKRGNQDGRFMSSNQIKYVPNPKPHPHVPADAPRTGVPVSPTRGNGKQKGS